jgi:hypothetical protein
MVCDKRICLWHVSELYFVSLILGWSQYLKPTFERSHASIHRILLDTGLRAELEPAFSPFKL